MPKYVLYCTQDAAPTVTDNGTLSCDGGVSAIQVGLLETTLNTPDTGSIATVWAAAFSLVLMCFVIARAVGVVLHMLREA